MTDTPPWGGQDEQLAARPDPGQPPGAPRPEYPPPGQLGDSQPGHSQPADGQRPGVPQPGYPPPGQPAYGQLPNYAQYGQPGYGQPGGWRPVGAPSPGGIPLRPLGLGDILSGAFSLIRQNPATTLGLTAIVLTINVVMWVLLGIISSVVSHPGLFFVGLIPTLLFLAVLAGGLTAAMGRGMLGSKISVGDAVRNSRPLWVVLAFILLLLIFLAISVPLVLVLHGWATIPVLLLWAWLGIMLILTIPVVVLERQGPLSAMRRSWRLVRGSYWRVLGIFLLTYFMLFVLNLIISIPLELISGVAAFTIGASTTGISVALIVTFIGEIVIYTVTTTILTGVFVLVYADMRMRKEGMDLVLQQAAQGRRLTGDEFATSRPGAGAYPGGGYPGGGYSGGGSPGASAPAGGS